MIGSGGDGRSAFRAVKAVDDVLMPLETQLLPEAFLCAFGMPASTFEHPHDGFSCPSGNTFRGPFTWMASQQSGNSSGPDNVGRSNTGTQASRFTRSDQQPSSRLQISPPTTHGDHADGSFAPDLVDVHLSQRDVQAIEGGAHESLVTRSKVPPQEINQVTDSMPDTHMEPSSPRIQQDHIHTVPTEILLVEKAPDSSDPSGKALYKSRVLWTDELHERFLGAIQQAGCIEASVPTVILKLMNVTGLTRENVASHLQKHRLGLKRNRSSKRKAEGPRIEHARVHVANTVVAGSQVDGERENSCGALAGGCQAGPPDCAPEDGNVDGERVQSQEGNGHEGSNYQVAQGSIPRPYLTRASLNHDEESNNSLPQTAIPPNYYDTTTQAGLPPPNPDSTPRPNDCQTDTPLAPTHAAPTDVGAPTVGTTGAAPLSHPPGRKYHS